MVRLVVNSGDSLWREVASRVRGAVLEPCSELESQLTGDVSDAVILVGEMSRPLETMETQLKARKHVLWVIETPTSSENCERLRRIAAENSVHLSLVNPDRFLPSRQLIRQQLDAGKLGEPGLVKIQRWQPANAAGSELPMALLRDLDTVLWLIGQPPNLVYACSPSPCGSEDSTIVTDHPGHKGLGYRDAETSLCIRSPGRFVQVHLGFDGGAMALIGYSDRMPAGDEYDSLTVIGSAGAAYADDHANRQLLFRGGTAQAVRTPEGVRQFVAMVQDFVDALAANRDLSASVNEWQRMLSVADAARESLVTRQSVRMEGR